ncbi:MAG: helix-turn-helix domain-containing protein [Bacteroidales bacterium]|nr:helix-turn-helix domain-containing protein [Bacteroidales bacterium]
MVNRIQEIIKRYDLSPSKLADTLEVPRSTISHILSERNKPSLEFIQKVIDKFPEISLNWLLKGEGNIFGKERDLFSDLYDEENKESTSKKDFPVSFPPESETESISVKDKEFPAYHGKEKAPEEIAAGTVNTQEENIKSKLSGKEKIVKLIVLYENGTFDEYFPA